MSPGTRHLCPTADFIPPTYEPLPYLLCHRPFEHLPAACKDFLTKNGIPLPSRDRSHDRASRLSARLIACRQALQDQLLTDLAGNDMLLLKLRYKAVLEGCSCGPPTPHSSSSMTTKERLRYLADVLLPARLNILGDFLARFDALIWAQLESWEYKHLRWSVKEQQRYRDQMVSGIIHLTELKTTELDLHVRSNHPPLQHTIRHVEQDGDTSEGNAEEDAICAPSDAAITEEGIKSALHASTPSLDEAQLDGGFSPFEESDQSQTTDCEPSPQLSEATIVTFELESFEKECVDVERAVTRGVFLEEPEGRVQANVIRLPTTMPWDFNAAGKALTRAPAKPKHDMRRIASTSKLQSMLRSIDKILGDFHKPGIVNEDPIFQESRLRPVPSKERDVPELAKSNMDEECGLAATGGTMQDKERRSDAACAPETGVSTPNYRTLRIATELTDVAKQRKTFTRRNKQRRPVSKKKAEMHEVGAAWRR